MSNVKDIVKEKYGETARQVAAGRQRLLLRRGRVLRHRGPDHLGPLRRGAKKRFAGEGHSGFPRLRKSDRASGTEARRNCARSWVRRRHRRSVVGKARRPLGKAYGLDMTDDMLALARENQKKAGVENVEFLKGEIENIPLPDNSVDVIISNCVINLSADKDRVLREAFRVLKPGGRFAVSDVVVRGKVPEDVRKTCCCGSGASPGRLKTINTRPSLRQRGFKASRLSRHAFTASRMRGRS